MEQEGGRMTVKELCSIVVSDVKITFDEDPNDGTIDVIIPICAEASDILGDGVLDLKVNLIKADGDAVVISTNSRW